MAEVERWESGTLVNVQGYLVSENGERVLITQAILDLLVETRRLHDALDTIASGHAFGPVEVARAALVA